MTVCDSIRLRAIVCSAVAIGLSACAPMGRFESAGTVAGSTIETKVDSVEAAYYLEHYLAGSPRDEALALRIESALARQRDAPTARESLGALSAELSPDFATLHFVATLYADRENRRMQDAFHAFVDALATSPQEELAATLAPYRDYHIVFVPGYAYRSNPANGADFSRQRAMLAELGFAPTLIETEDQGLVDTNVAIVTAAVRELAAMHDKLILVSASKGGAEVAAALSNLRTDPAIDSIKAWISVGGLLRGSPYADRYLAGVRNWFARFMLRRRGQPEGILEDLSTVVRRPAFDALELPAQVLMLHYVGAPLSGQIADETRGRYKMLRRLGPNDGLTLLADELTENGLVVTEVGLDHYFRAPDIDQRTIALTYAVFTELARREAQRSQPVSFNRLMNEAFFVSQFTVHAE